MTRGMHTATTFLVLLLGGAYGCRITIEPTFVPAEEDFTRSADVQNAASLSVDWEDGTVEVRVDPAASGVTVTGTKHVTAGSTEEAEDILAEWDIELSVAESDPPQLFLRFAAPAGTGRFFRADAEVILPAGLRLSIDSDDAIIIVSVERRGNYHYR